MDERNIMFEVAVLGKRTQEFLSTDIGNFIAQRAQQEYNDGVRTLLATPPTDTDAIIAAQVKAKTAQNIISWFDEAIQAGIKALHILEERGE